MNIEKWKSVPGFSDYLISDLGNVRSLKRGSDRLMSPSTSDGYRLLTLCAGGKRTNRPVHQLVVLAFIGPRPEGMEVRHLNGIRSDNRLENLMYGTKKENMADRALHGNDHEANKIHCPSGHPYNLSNTYIRKATSGGLGRDCKICKRIAVRTFRLKQKEAK